MMEYSTSLDNSSGASSKFDVVIECLLVGLLAFMPLALGVVHAWSEEVVNVATPSTSVPEPTWAPMLM